MNELYTEFVKLGNQVKKIYMYGTGVFARIVFKLLKDMNVSVDGFVETRPDKSEFEGLPVYGIDELIGADCGFILGLNSPNSRNVIHTLSAKGFDISHVIYGYKYVQSGKKEKYEDKIIEVTTRVGCRVNCKYCPQSTLIRQYNSKTGADTEMSF
jgi:ribosome-associated protein YbcJ (S4-like RNA binding protein)